MGKPFESCYFFLQLPDTNRQRLLLKTYRYDTDIEEGCKARVWQEIHFEKMCEQIDREAENKAVGQFFLPGENSFISVEPFMMHNLAEAYLLKTQCFE